MSARLNRAPSGPFAPPDRPIRRNWTPWIAVMLGSLTVVVPHVATMPLLPPFGLMVLLCWRALRPGLLPVWAPTPLGLFDDLLSGQPIGSAIVLWTLCVLAYDVIDRRLLWRDFRQDWTIGAVVLGGYLAAAAALAWQGPGQPPWPLIGVQWGLTIATLPLVVRAVLWLDDWRQS